MNLSANKTYSVTVQFILFVLPNFSILVAYPIIFRKQSGYRRRIVGRNIINFHKSVNVQARPNRGDSAPETGEAIVDIIRLARSVRRTNRGFAVLTLLTASVLICWTPLTIFYTVSCFVGSIQTLSSFQMAGLLFLLEAIADPILFSLAIQTLRDTLKTIFHIV